MSTATLRESHPEEEPLTYRKILIHYLPLALSWLFMAIEGPVSVGIISRMTDANTQTAAFLLIMSLALVIESPVIDLLSTSTTLSKNRQYYVEMSRFTWYMIAWVTFAGAVLVIPPVYEFVTGTLLSIPEAVRRAAWPAMVVMVPWSAFVGWRRYLHGILIRSGRSGLVGIGTFMRIFMMAGTGILLMHTTDLSGAVVVAWGLLASVASEAVYAHIVSRRTIHVRFNLQSGVEPNLPPLTQRKLFSFHLPLAATTAVTLAQNPLVASAVGRGPGKDLAMAAWQVAVSLIFLHRTVAFALPEIVISQHRNRQTAEKLFRFCAAVGVSMSGLLFTLWATRLDVLFFTRVLDANPETADMAHLAILCAAGLPLINALGSYVRGMLTSHHLTAARFGAIIVSTTVLLAMLALGVYLGWPGVVNAGVALTSSLAVELIVLARSWVVGHRRLAARSV